MVSPLTVLSPMVALLVGALVAFALLRQAVVPATEVRLVAVVALLLALALAHRLQAAYAPMVMLPFGNISIPVVDMRLDAIAVSWLRYMLVAGLALVLLIPAESLAAALALLAAASVSLSAGTLGALAIAWLATETAFLLFDTPGSRAPMSAVPLSLGGACMVLAVFASASQEAMVLSDASLKPHSWVLLLAAVCLRLRLWPLSWPTARPSLTALWLLVSCCTAATVVVRLAQASVAAQVPLWVSTSIVLSATVSSLRGWTSPDGTVRQDAGMVLAALVLPLAATTLPASSRLAPALAHLSAVIVVLAVAPAVPPYRRLPGCARSVVPLLAVLTLVPLPLLPFGTAYAEAITRLAAERHVGGILSVLAMALAGALMVCRALDLTDRPALSRRNAPHVAALLAVSLLLVALGLGLGADWGSGQQGAVPVSLAAVALAWLGVAAAAGLVYGRQNGLLAFAPPSPFVGAWPQRLAIALLRSIDTLLRLVEGETALTWTTVIGVAVLSIALRT